MGEVERSEITEITDNTGSVIGMVGTPEAMDMDDDEAYVSLVRIPRLMC